MKEAHNLCGFDEAALPRPNGATQDTPVIFDYLIVGAGFCDNPCGAPGAWLWQIGVGSGPAFAYRRQRLRLLRRPRHPGACLWTAHFPLQ